MRTGYLSTTADTARTKPELAGSRLVRRAVTSALGVVIAVLIAKYGGVLFNGHRHIGQTDFLGYYSGGRLVLEGHGRALYDLRALQHLQQSIVYPSRMSDPVLPVLTPPYVAFLLIPFSILPYGAAYGVWMILNAVLLLFSTLALQRRAMAIPGRLRLGWIAVLGFVPTLLALSQGQLSFLILALLVQCFLLFSDGREGRAGVFLALALIKPPYVLPFLLVILVQGRWRALGGFGLMTLGLLLAPLAFLGASVYPSYWRLTQAVSGMQGHLGVVRYAGVRLAPSDYDPHLNYSPLALVQLLSTPPLSTGLLLGVLLASAGATAFVARRTSSMNVPFAVATLCALLISPHVLAHDLLLLLIPGAIALGFARRHQGLVLGLLLGGLAALDLGGVLPTALRLETAITAVLALGLGLLWMQVTSTPDAVCRASNDSLAEPSLSVSGSGPKLPIGTR